MAASSPESLPHARGRPDPGAAVAWTGELYAQHARLVAGLCRALLRDAAEAEDAAQQTFLSAHRSLLNGAVPEEPAAWLATIARNECWARIRARMRRPLPTAAVEGALSSSDPLAEAIRRADLAAIWAALAQLPQQQRDALLLREFGGLSYEELAVALSVSGPAVESLLFRARQGVRARLSAGYASVTGGAWIDGLARLGSVIGGGMAPVAAKVAAVGVGAAVATGGAVVAPQMFEHAQHHAVPATHLVAHHVVSTVRPAAASTPIAYVAHAAPTRHTVALVRRSTGDNGQSTDHGSGLGDERQTTSAQPQEHETDGTSETRSTAQSHEGSASAGDHGGDQQELSNGASTTSGDGGAAPTTPDPAETVTLSTADAAPVEGDPAPGGDG